MDAFLTIFILGLSTVLLLGVILFFIYAIVYLHYEIREYRGTDRKAKKIYEETMFKNANAKDYILRLLDHIDDSDYGTKLILQEILNILD